MIINFTTDNFNATEFGMYVLDDWIERIDLLPEKSVMSNGNAYARENIIYAYMCTSSIATREKSSIQLICMEWVTR